MYRFSDRCLMGVNSRIESPQRIAYLANKQDLISGAALSYAVMGQALTADARWQVTP
ncbi:hypothetical protein [Sphingobium bisphenolivorans]|uniref:hypothetical protein n=1 Tax=Sphingobium bisphenolivorans TaxID=1335760 RepID=UPI0003A2C258|nr:hypothetical protein [Sphingobium bisphenolivorans]